jgi:hypothetical protein
VHFVAEAYEHPKPEAGIGFLEKCATALANHRV